MVQVGEYRYKYKSKHTIIYSTVPIGTCGLLDVTHSPVEGRHPNLEKSIRTMVRWLGSKNKSELDFFDKLFKEKNIKTRLVDSPEFTEFLKLRSTSKYGVNLVWADYEKSVADDLGMDFELLKEFDRNYNELYEKLDEDWAKRYVLDPPGGKINGHCVVPNSILLDKQYPNQMLKMIEEMK